MENNHSSTILQKKAIHRPRQRATLFTVFAFLALLLVYFVGNLFVKDQLYQSARREAGVDLSLLNTSLSNILTNKLSMIHGLSAYISAELSEEGSIQEDELNKFFEVIYVSNTGVRNIAIAPEGVMEYVFPYEPNKSVIGYNPAEDPRPEVREEVRRAIETQQQVVSLPNELIQGGMGLIIRQAIFIEDNYWGLSNIVFDLDELLEESGVTTSDLSLALLDQNGNLFWGDSTVFSSDPVVVQIDLPEGAWTLAGAPKGGWRTAYVQNLRLFQVLGLSIVALVSGLIHGTIYRRQKLLQLVDQRTAELQATSILLRRDIEEKERLEAEHTKLLESESQQRVLAETLSEVTLLISSHISMPDLLDEILAQIHKVVYYKTANIVLLEDGLLLTKASQGYNREEQTFLKQFSQPIDEFHSDFMAITTKKPVVFSDVSKDPYWIILPTTHWIKSYMVIPICYQDQVLGLIRMDGKDIDTFCEEDADKLMPLANAAAIALNNAALYQQAQNEIVERKKAEDRFRELNDRLEIRVEERTAQLTQINTQLEAFAYSISHDLRAPVRAIQGFAQLLMEEYPQILAEGGTDYLNRILSSSKKMNNLIDGLLALSHLGRQDLIIEQLDLTALTGQLISEMKEQSPDREIDFSVQEGLTVLGDRQLVETLLTNLISNAVKFTRHKDTANIEFGKVNHQDENAFFLKDNGEGFDMAYIDALFEPFQRLSQDADVEGTGIGLAIAQRVVQRHGGRIWAEAEPGMGATFYFTLSSR